MQIFIHLPDCEQPRVWWRGRISCCAVTRWAYTRAVSQWSFAKFHSALLGPFPCWDTVLRWEYIAGYLPLIWKSGLFPTFNAANIVLIPYLDYMFGLQSHKKSLESNRTLFTLMGSHIHNSEYSLIMSFNDIKIKCETFWMFKTLYLMVPWSFATLEPEKIDQILIFQFVQWLCLCDVKYLPLKVFGQRGCLIF